jgi:acetoin utilization deacetylase AcuC-like enzyme
MKILYSPECAGYNAPGHPESPRRATGCAELLRQNPRHEFMEPQPCGEADILRVHTPRLLEQVRRGESDDGDTPAVAGIFEHARRSAGAAIQAASLAWRGTPAFSLMRPPGHHACRDRLMGFCYFNNLAIALARLLAESGAPRRVAIVDFDCHHGNGTEEILRGVEPVLCVSLHQSPCYPGSGLRSEGNALNYPLPPGTEPARYMETFANALTEVRRFDPELVAVEAGFDAYKRDPLTDMRLEIETFDEIGRRLAALQRPMFALLEGGYSSQLPKCVAAFLDGWESGDAGGAG